MPVKGPLVYNCHNGDNGQNIEEAKNANVLYLVTVTILEANAGNKRYKTMKGEWVKK